MDSAFIHGLSDVHCQLKFNTKGVCEGYASTLWIVDFKREQKMGFGHSYGDMVPGKGEVVVNKERMKAFNVQVQTNLPETKYKKSFLRPSKLLKVVESPLVFASSFSNLTAVCCLYFEVNDYLMLKVEMDNGDDQVKYTFVLSRCATWW